MSLSSQISKTSIYQDFLNLDDRSYEGIIQFFERNEHSIHQLDFWEYFELHAVYLQSLFESGRYKRFLACCDWLIEKSMEENVHLFKGVDIYQDTIFRKAASLYNTEEPIKAAHIGAELIKMYPKNEMYQMLFKRCYLKEMFTARTRWKFIGALTLLFCSIIIGIELIVFRRLDMPHVATVELIRNVIFFIGVLLIVGSESYYHLTARIKLRKIRS